MSGRAALTVALGPAGAGKTRWCLDRFREAGEGGALLVAPSRAYGDRLRAALGLPAPPRGRKKEDGPIVTFGDLARRIACDTPGLQTVQRGFARLLLASLFEETAAPDDYFGRMRGVGGFPGSLAACVRALKLAGVTPPDLDAAAEPAAAALGDPDFARKARETARLYAAYERFLRERGLRDDEDVLRAAIERAAADGELPGALARIRRVLVAGHFRLARLHRDLLAALAARGVEVAVTLPDDADRPLLFATPRRTLAALHQEFAVTEVRLDRAPDAACPAVLCALERRLFGELRIADCGLRNADERPTRSTQYATRDPQPSTLNRQPSLVLFDAPNTYAEAEMVARALRREHEERSTRWARCAIVLRAPADYAPILRSVCARLEVPLALDCAQAAADHPLVKTLAALFDTVLNGWQREDVVAFLKSSYVEGGKLAADRLRLRAARRGLREGRDGWERLAGELAQPDADTEGDGDASASPLRRTLEAMLSFDRTLMAGPRTAQQFRETVQAILRDFGLREARGADQAADRLALEQVELALTHLSTLAELTKAGPTPFRDYHARLMAALRAASFTPPAPADAVRVVEPAEAPRLDAAVVAVMGLTERVFPRRVVEDPFFRDDERDALAPAGVLLEPARDYADDERLLFYLAAAAPGERLILSFPRSSAEADTLPSFYLEEVRAVFAGDPAGVPAVVRTLADVAPRPEECANAHDRLLSACAGHPADSTIENRKSKIEDTSSLPRLPAIDLDDVFAAYTAPRRYSVTELECYLRCPFQHLMKYGLRLREQTEGGGAADRGTLLHAALRRAMRKRAERAEQLTVAEMQAALLDELEGCVGERPVDARPHRRAMMRRAVSDALEGFAEREERYGGAFHLTPTYFELAFGQAMDEGGEGEADDEDMAADAGRDYDRASRAEPLVIAGQDGQPDIHLCGAIDRVDLSADGRHALVLDYKLGATVEWDHIRQGKSLQMPLYMMAVEQLWGRIPAVGCYDSPRDRGRRRFFRKTEVDVRAFAPILGVEDGRIAKPLGPDDWADAIRMAQAQVRSAVEGIRAGRVMPTPGDHCRFCAYADTCRTTPDGAHDGEPFDAGGPS